MGVVRVEAIDQAGQRHEATLDKDPDHCPICHHGIQPRDFELSFYLDETASAERVERVFQCPRDKCGHLFIARYVRGSGALTLWKCVPFELQDAGCQAEVRALSPNFYDIFNQAQKAERSGWILVAGPGYRKALEFLIKDFACKQHPAETDKIKKIELGPCIQEYIKNELVRETATRAAWLGNDETHYLRKWEDKDLQDLKALLNLVTVTIQSELLYENMKKAMPQGKK